MPAVPPRRKTMVRNLAAGFLGAWGGVSFLCFFWLVLTWSGAAPGAPQPELGLTFPHEEHGRIGYWSAFQSTAAFLLLFTSAPLILVAVELSPKRNVRVRVGPGWHIGWDPDDPDRMARWGSALGVLAAPAFIVFAGPPIVRALNAWGVSLSLG